MVASLLPVFRAALFLGSMAAGTYFAWGAESGSAVAVSQQDGWSNRDVASQAAELTGPDTIAVYHLRFNACEENRYVGSWLDSFEKRIACEALEEIGVREAVGAIDLDASGALSTRTVLGMRAGYLDGSATQREIEVLLRPISDRIVFERRAVRLVSDEQGIARTTLDVERLERQLASVSGHPLRLATVQPAEFAPASEAFVSAPIARTSTSSGITFLVGFDYASENGVVRLTVGDATLADVPIAADGPLAQQTRILARLARKTTTALTSEPATEEEPQMALADAMPPFGLPLAD